MLQRRLIIISLPANPQRTILTIVLLFLNTLSLLIALAIGLSPRCALALPLYARQTGQPCATCHTAFLELTPFGRRFKLGGYTLTGGDWKGPPFAVMFSRPSPTPRAPSLAGPRPGSA